MDDAAEQGRAGSGRGEGGDVVVLGSANADLVLGVAELPRPGETVLAAHATRACGGKGANQAIAAARAGARTSFLGAIGDDVDGAMLRAELCEAGVDLSALRTLDAPTGVAVVTVDARAENSIVVVPGANADEAPLGEDELACVRAARVLLCQLETPQARFAEAARAARTAGTRVLLNAAPAGDALEPTLWPLIDVLIVNEHELAALAAREGGAAETSFARDAPAAASTPPVAAEALLALVPCLIVTLGARGALIATRERGRARVPAPQPARVVDTTGAGDAFCGVLAASLAGGAELADAVVRANAAGSLAVEHAGAAPAMPSAEAIAARLARE